MSKVKQLNNHCYRWTKRVLLLSFSLFLLFAGVEKMLAVSILESPNVSIPKPSDVASAKYSFIAKKTEKTKVIPFGTTKWKEVPTASGSRYFSFNPMSGSQELKGKIGVKYTNVGYFNEKELDLKITIVDWKSYINQTGYISFGASHIGHQMQGYDWVNQKWEFVETGTDKLVKVSGFMTINDIDVKQYIQFSKESSSKFKNVYVADKNNLIEFDNINGEYKYSDDIGRSTEANDKTAMFTFMYEDSSSISFKWGRDYAYYGLSRDHVYDPGNSAGDYFGYLSKKPIKTEVLSPVKNVSDLDEKEVTENTLTTVNESFLYNIRHTVLDEFSEFYYKEYTFTDTIQSDLVVNKVRVENELGKNVTALFDNQTKGNVVKLVAKPATLKSADFYGHDYHFIIDVSLKAGIDFNALKDPLVIKNKGSVSVDNESKVTNETITRLPEKPKVTIPKKVVSDLDEKNVTENILSQVTEKYSYKISHSILEDLGGYYFKSYEFTDTVQSELVIEKVRVENEAGKEVTGLFDNQTKGNVVKLVAKPATLKSADFYGHDYHFIIDVSLKAGIDFNGLKDPLVIKNKGSVSVDNESKVTNETSTFVPQVNVTFKKVSENGKPVVGAVYEWRDSSDKVLGSVKTDKEGNGIFPYLFISNGSYYLIETEAPEGYILNKSKESFDYVIDKKNLKSTIDFEKAFINNAQKGDISVRKVTPQLVGFDKENSQLVIKEDAKDLDKDKPLASSRLFGWTMTAFANDEKDTKGVNYPLFEDKPQKDVGYKVFAKVDYVAPDGTLLAKEGEEIAEMVTNDKGVATLKNVYPGEFVVIEQFAPLGIQVDPTPIYVTLTYAGQEVEHIVGEGEQKDELQRVKLRVPKLFEEIQEWKDGQSVTDYVAGAGATFGLYNATDIVINDEVSLPVDTLLTELVIDEKGESEALVDLVRGGKYYVKEISTRPHYELLEEKYFFTYEPTTNDEFFAITIFENGVMYDEIFKPIEKDSEKEETDVVTLRAVATETSDSKDQNEKIEMSDSEKEEELVKEQSIIKNEMIKRDVSFIKEKMMIKDYKVTSDKYLGSFDSSYELGEGAEFTLFDSKKKELISVLSQSNGLVEFKGLPVGQFFFTESKTFDDSFRLDQTMYELTVTADKFVISGEDKKEIFSQSYAEMANDDVEQADKKAEKEKMTMWTVKNDKKEGQTVISKQEKGLLNSKELAGNTLLITTDDKGKDVVFEWVTSDKPFKFDLPAGDYFIFEKKASKDYELNTDFVKVVVEDGKTVNKVFYNNKLINKIVNILPQTGEAMQLWLVVVGITLILGIVAYVYTKQEPVQELE